MTTPQPDSWAQVRDFIESQLKGITYDLERLNQVAERSEKAIAGLELTVTRELVTAQKDIESLRVRVVDVIAGLQAEEDVRQESDIAISKRLTDHENASAQAWKEHNIQYQADLAAMRTTYTTSQKEQQTENVTNKNMRGVIAALFLMVVPMLIKTIYELIIK